MGSVGWHTWFGVGAHPWRRLKESGQLTSLGYGMWGSSHFEFS